MPTGHTRSKRVKVSDPKQLVYDRRHRCSFVGCDKAFTRSEHLRRHQLNHEPSRRWACGVCSATFARQDLWKRHLAVTHNIGASQQASGSKCVSGCSFQSSCQCSPVSREHEERETSMPIPSGGDAHSRTQSVAEIGATFAGSLHEQSPYSSTEGLPSSFGSDLLTYDPDLFGLNMAPDLPDNDFAWDIDYLGGTGIEWFLNNETLPIPSVSGAATIPTSVDGIPPVPIGTESNIAPQDSRQPQAPSTDLKASATTTPTSSRSRPIFLQESQSKLFIPDISVLKPPSCGFRICTALTDEMRLLLLSQLKVLIPEGLDTDEPIFSLNSMRHGIHLYFRHVSIEFPFIHHEFLAPSSEESKRAVIAVLGEADAAPGPLLLWSIISMGWSLMRSRGNREYHVSTRIQRTLRTSILGHPSLAYIPPLWLVQALFVIILFARYQGDREDYGFASIFHGVLLESARRLDNSPFTVVTRRQQASDGIPLVQSWIHWIKAESIQRLTRHAFILDVNYSILHGGEPSMMPFDVNIKLPTADDTWYSMGPEDWEKALSERKFVPLVDMLKTLWNPRSTPENNPGGVDISAAVPRGSNIALYGLISIARELRRRKEVKFLDNHAGGGGPSPNVSLASLGNTVIHSLRNWEPIWKKVAVPNDLTANYLWRDCACMIHLAYTLYEVGPVDLQTVTGKTVIEGKKKGAADYARSRRRIGRWVKEDRAWIGLSRAATVVRSRIYNISPEVVHCHHCLWCLYLATLICWSFGFALTGNSSPEHLVRDSKIISREQAEAECSRYLDIAVSLPDRMVTDKSVHDELGNTTGLLLVLIRFFRSQCRTGMIMESIESLMALVQVTEWDES